MPRLELSLLGPFQALLDGKPVTGFESNKVRALLAYLLVEAGRPHPRPTLAGLLWPARPDSNALANLRYALSNLRDAIDDRNAAPPFLLITPETLQFNGRSEHWLDVDVLRLLLRKDDVDALRRGVALYRGDFLAGLSLGDAAPFEEWAVLMREQSTRAFLSALGRLVRHFEGLGNYEEAGAYAEQAVKHAPWDEEGHQQLMRVLALGGHRAAAQAAYAACCRLLAAELDVAPGRDTVLLYEAIRDGKLVAPRRTAALAANPEVTEPVWHACVAREPELARLDAFLKRALTGSGQVAFVTGEAGSGKTVLLEEFTRRSLAAQVDLIAAGGRCNAYTGHGDPYLPFLEILGLLSGDRASWPATGKLTEEYAHRLLASLPHVAQALLDYAPDLIDRFVHGAMLLARMQAAGRGPTARLEAWLQNHGARGDAASVQQINLFQQFTRAMQVLSHDRPLLLMVDDLQWADAGSIGLLFHLGRRLAGHRILLVGAYRPGALAAGRDGQQHPLEAVIHELRRERGDIQVDLGGTDGRQFVDALLDSEPNCLAPSFRQMLYRHTEGLPLFTVEFLRGLQERGDLTKDGTGRWTAGAELNWDTLPPRVEAVIAERIGRLPQHWQALLAAASVEGEAFSTEVLARTLASWRPELATHEPEIMQCLSGPLAREHRLVLAEGVGRSADRRFSRYRFRHFLFQKYLYGRLDAVERARLHESVAHELEALAGPVPGLLAVHLAWHYESAGIAEKAISYYRQAGDLAGSVGAAQAATEHYRRGLQLLAAQPDTAERAERELRLLLSLGAQLAAGSGYAHPHVRQVYDRARALCRPLAPGPQLVPALRGLGGFYSLRAEYETTGELYEQLAVIAQRTEDPVLAAEVDRLQGYLALITGAVAPARAHLERALTGCDPVREGVEPWSDAALEEPIAVCHTWLSWTLWLLGYADQALVHSRAAQARVKTMRPFDAAFALALAATLHTLRHDPGAARERAAAAKTLASEKGFPFWLAVGEACHGWAIAQQGCVEEGLAEVREGAEFIRLSGARQSLPWSLMLLGETLGQAGCISEGLEAFAEALEEENRAGSRFASANLLRLRGEFLLRQDETNEREAETCFWQAISAARDQEARSWELRAAMSLWRLCRRQGRQKEGRAVLAPVYGWFTEGYDEPDLREARALLVWPAHAETA
jgi:predicted ATPase